MDGLERTISDDIATLSRQLCRLYETHAAFTHPAVLECSVQLDRLIVECYRTECASSTWD
ncbi:aspartyl-phosphate phosphatase Spo0E family protein [Sulfobacillus sp. DSM 109850]|uniref:Aspartyl-phosphate phosphatase Spo0E family protein n=2 Tax=Sulfobacillus harzensis TaxID=2729629 RepID=A0A7Y0L2R8_9FIRM|nr:aspartyl-phosphate phosphatase Spo0E family protein [Sulfobacillus harzensis]